MVVTDLAVYAADASALSRLDDAGRRIEVACEQACAWLRAGIGIPIEDIVELRAQASAVATFAQQKKLGRDAELAAMEVQRRAERGIGLAIRRGQADGAIVKQGMRGSDLVKPDEFLSKHELAHSIYPVTDGVSDEQYETAIADAKAEGNLSKNNVRRRITGMPTRHDRRLTSIPHFNSKHPLADDATDRCQAAGHGESTQINGACGDCWEAAIRLDAISHYRCLTCTGSAVSRDGIRQLLLDGKSAQWIISQGASRADVIDVLRDLNRQRITA